MSQAPGRTFQFGEFEFDARHRELRKNGAPVKLQLQPLRVLALLVERAGQVITREEIRQCVWGEETFVDYEQGLNYCIRQIRAALEEDGEKTRYIETLPRRGYRFIAAVTERAAGKAGEQRVMLAVLPLENLSADQEQEYLSDGLTDEIISRLASLSGEQLGVIARTSAMQYKRTTKSIKQIGEELSVDYVVEGTARRDGNRVRISSQLIRVSDQTHMWAQVYERELADVLLLQSELALAIAGEVRGKLVPGKAAAARPVRPEAYESYLKGRYLWNRRTKADLFRALELFGAAIERDLEYAAAFAGLADAYLALLDYRAVRTSEALAQASAAALNALRLDDQLADAHASLAHAKLHAFEWEAAERGFRKAIELAPGYATAHFYYANLLIGLERFDAGLREAREALRLDPVSAAAESNVAILSFHAGKSEDALEACRRALALNPELPRPHEDLGRILVEQGKYPEALAALERAVELSRREIRYVACLGYAHALSGNQTRAREILGELRTVARQQYVDAYDLAFVHAALGEPDEAFSRLEEAWEERSSVLPFLKIDGRLRSLRGDPRFHALLARVGLKS